MSPTIFSELTRRLDQRRGACALIAIKARARCKSRLAQVLATADRIELVRCMLTAVLAAARAAKTVRHVLVVSPERDGVPGAVPVLADSGGSLNRALTQAQTVLGDSGWRELVILPADLPNVSAAEIDALVHAGRTGGFAIAPDDAQSGTNALYLGSPSPFHFQFGPDSKRLHLEEARRLGLTPEEVHLSGLQFDVDSPRDLRRLQEQRWLARLQA
ncbi:MAG TPA: 2-phospho-L-lactate guanylyltransferase [Steroidobacteraceae bacterium]